VNVVSITVVSKVHASIMEMEAESCSETSGTLPTSTRCKDPRAELESGDNIVLSRV
jgi:hypothetical protein